MTAACEPPPPPATVLPRSLSPLIPASRQRRIPLYRHQRWPFEECFQAAKNEAGLDHYQVRLYNAWYRYVTLAMLALAWLAATRAALADDDDQPATSANEIRRMFTALCCPPRGEQHARRWSRWRQRHQQRARHCHYQRHQLEDR